MLYRVHDDYLIRGWDGAPYTVMHRPARKISPLDFVKFRVLLLCDGVTDLDLNDLSEQEREALHKMLEEEIIVTCAEKEPLRDEQKYRCYPNRYVKSVLWSVTGRCNFNCKHCYMDAPNGTLGEISHEAAMHLIDEMADCGIMDVALTGGEVFVRSDVWELIRHLTERGITITQIYTNGWLVNEAVLERLKDLGQCPEFEFSFDGVGWHDWLRGVDGAEKQLLEVIELCQKQGFPTGVESSFHKGSIGSLRETVKLMGKMNCHIKIGSIMMTDLWREHHAGYAFSDQEYYDEVLNYIPQFFEDGMPANLTIGGVIELHKGSTEYRIIPEKHDGTEKVLNRYLCGAARMNAYISADGRLLPCMPMTAWKGHTCFPKVQDVGLSNGLTDSFYMNFVGGKVRDLFEKNSKCNQCKDKLYCAGGCRAKALEDGDDLFGCDLGNCFFWESGYLKKVRKTTEEAIERYCKDPC